MTNLSALHQLYDGIIPKAVLDVARYGSPEMVALGASARDVRLWVGQLDPARLGVFPPLRSAAGLSSIQAMQAAQPAASAGRSLWLVSATAQSEAQRQVASPASSRSARRRAC